MAADDENVAAADKSGRKRKRKKKVKKPKEALRGFQDVGEEADDGMEIEYVAAAPDIDLDDPAWASFKGVMTTFTKTEADKEEAAAAPVKEKEVDQAPMEDSDKGSESSSEDEAEEQISRKRAKKLARLSVAELKQLVKRPDVVEVHDATANDPRLLVHLKACRNTVPVPRHWKQKRKYLQGKRGVEKIPFALPDFIAATGIEKIRAAIEEKDAEKRLKGKTREKLQPKMGRMDIDYQVLHDAFFKYQTKPPLTRHGDLYYEAKEFQVNMREKRPGELSDELKAALGIPEGAPPPWLINMQRYGPPPSYPDLKIAGLNSPIPAGASFGYHPGGWGRPPVDEFGRPLYGDVFGISAPELPPEISQPIERRHWGVLPEEEEEESESSEESEAPEAPEPEEEEEEREIDGLTTPAREAGITSVTGLETPDAVELRKQQRANQLDMEAAAAVAAEGRPLYQVLATRDNSVGSALMGSSHTYVLPSAPDPKLPKSKDRVPHLGVRSQAGDQVNVTLDASDLAELDENMIRKKYEEARATEKATVNSQREDVSDIMAEGTRRQTQQRKKDEAKNKKAKEFRF